VTQRDRLDPFAASLTFEAGRRVDSGGELLAALLTDIGEACHAAGCSLIGHIKCHAAGNGRAFACSLTSRRTGAACRGAHLEPLEPGASLEVELVVLVYGLSRDTVDAAVRQALARSAKGSGGDWALCTESHSHSHASGSC